MKYQLHLDTSVSSDVQTNGMPVVSKINGNPFLTSILLYNNHRNVNTVELKSAEIPIGFYNIRYPYNTFIINGTTYTVPPGNYTITTLLAIMGNLSQTIFSITNSIINIVPNPPGNVITYAGQYNVVGNTDGVKTAATFSYPLSIVSTGNGKLYTMGQYDNSMRRIDLASGQVTTLKTTTWWACGLAYDGVDTIYAAATSDNTIRKYVISTNTDSILAGSAGDAGYVDATGEEARFNSPRGLAYYSGVLYVADAENYRIRAVDVTSGAVTTFAGSGTDETTNGTGVSASFSHPYDVAADTSAGILYVVEERGQCIRKVTISSAEVVTWAGTPGEVGSNNGPGLSARFGYPNALCIDDTFTRIYVGDTGNAMIRQVETSSAVVSTLAGQTAAGYVDAVGTSAKFNVPFGVATYSGYLYECDAINQLIRRVTLI
jgi:WD40 repeat protein